MTSAPSDPKHRFDALARPPDTRRPSALVEVAAVHIPSRAGPMNASGALVATTAYARTRLRARTLRTREGLLDWRERRLHRWLREHATAVPAYAPLAGAIARDGLRAVPVIDKDRLLARFADHNRLDLSAADALAMADEGRGPPGHAVGSSTGTSGNRLPYVISERERHVWLGTVLAKALPDVVRRRHRVAAVLPDRAAFYDTADASGAFGLLLVLIHDGLEAMARALERFGPTVVIAPPQSLRWLAENGTAIAPERVFSGAEVLDPLDRAIIERAFPRAAPMGELYMASEGLFAVSCRHGTLHLTEDCVHFELEPTGEGLVSSIVTDFTRTAQIMLRYRMNDLLRLGPDCPCGSPLQPLAAVEGRSDDAFAIEGPGGVVTVTPDVLRAAAVGVSPLIDDYRLVQTGPRTIVLRLAPHVPEAVRLASREAVAVAVRRMGAVAEVELDVAVIEPPVTRKLRRVERRWRPDLTTPPSEPVAGVAPRMREARSAWC